MIFETSFFRYFESICFPVFVTDAKCKVVYKNNCAARYLRDIRKGSNISSKMADDSGLKIAREERIGLAVFPSLPLYSRALIFTLGKSEGSYLVFAFLTKLQMNDYEETYSKITESFSSDFISLLSFVRCEEYSGENVLVPSRLYAETADRICFYADELGDICLCDMADYLMKIKSRCARAFSALGYRMNYCATKEFLENRMIFLNVGDFSFSFFMALYAVMKNSADKSISIKADYDPLRMSLEIIVSSPVTGLKDGAYKEDHVVPECAEEIKLCEVLPCGARRFSYVVENGVLSASAFLEDGKTKSARVRSVARKPSYREEYAMLSFIKTMLSDYLKNGEK